MLKFFRRFCDSENVIIRDVRKVDMNYIPQNAYNMSGRSLGGPVNPPSSTRVYYVTCEVVGSNGYNLLLKAGEKTLKKFSLGHEGVVYFRKRHIKDFELK